jgi:hypothetical protein
VRAVLPTPTVGMVGVLPDVRRRATMALARDGDVVLLLGEGRPSSAPAAYLAAVHGLEAGEPPALDLAAADRLVTTLAGLVQAGLVDVAHDVGDGGIAVALAEMAIAGGRGVDATLAVDARWSARRRPVRRGGAPGARGRAGGGRGAVAAACEAAGRALALGLGPVGGARVVVRAGDLVRRRAARGGARRLRAHDRRGAGVSARPWHAFDDDHPREECGVVGVHLRPGAEGDVAGMVQVGLFALQHRGQESCGICVASPDEIRIEKDMGLVAEVFTEERLDTLRFEGARTGIGHTRYSTTGSSLRFNAQPLTVRSNKGLLALAHNGNFTNARAIRDGMLTAAPCSRPRTTARS